MNIEELKILQSERDGFYEIRGVVDGVDFCKQLSALDLLSLIQQWVLSDEDYEDEGVVF